MNTHYREATVEDVRHVANNLRPADLREMLAHGHKDVFATLLEGFVFSNPCNAMVDRNGETFGLFGAVPNPQNEWSAAVWMMATPTLEKEALGFARGSRKILEEWSEQYRLLFNVVDSRNEVHLKWLKWLGFTFLNEININHVPFYEFLKVNPHV